MDGGLRCNGEIPAPLWPPRAAGGRGFASLWVRSLGRWAGGCVTVAQRAYGGLNGGRSLGGAPCSAGGGGVAGYAAARSSDWIGARCDTGVGAGWCWSRHRSAARARPMVSSWGRRMRVRSRRTAAASTGAAAAGASCCTSWVVCVRLCKSWAGVVGLVREVRHDPAAGPRWELAGPATGGETRGSSGAATVAATARGRSEPGARATGARGTF